MNVEFWVMKKSDCLIPKEYSYTIKLQGKNCLTSLGLSFSSGLETLRNMQAILKLSSTGGSVVECSPATRAARVRFPASASPFFVSISI